MIEFFIDWILAVAGIVIESGPYLVVGLTVAGLLQVLLPRQRVARHLGRDDFRSTLLATLFGAPLPLCSCSVIPTAVELRKKGASKGATASFLVSTPETGVDSIGITWALLDPIMTVVRPVAAVTTALVTGTLVNLLVRLGLVERGDPARDVAMVAPGAGAETACCDDEQHDHAHDHADHAHDHADHAHDHAHDAEPAHDPAPRPRGVRGVAREAVRYGFGPLLADLTPWFVIGFLLSGLIVVVVHDNFFAEVAPGGIYTMLLMLVIASPMYICATASTPIAAALIAKGLAPGAALVLMLAGPAVNVATMIVVSKLLGRRVFLTYLVTIATLALCFGLLIDQIYAASGIDLQQLVTLGAAEGYGLWSLLGGAILGVAILYHAVTLGLWARFERWLGSIGLSPGPRLLRCAVLVIALAAWLSSAYDAVGPGSSGFVTRFGKVVDEVTGPGHSIHLPYPIDTFETVSTQAIRRVRLALDEGGEVRRDTLPARDAVALGAEHLECVTSDEKLLVIGYTIHYVAAAARPFRYELVDDEALIRATAMSALRRMVARHTMDEHLIERREPLEHEVRGYLDADLAALAVGVRVVAVRFEYIHAPEQVHHAYRDVASALEDKQTEILNARAYESQQLAQARARAEVIVQQAEQERARAVARARGEVAAFLALAAVRASHGAAVDESLRLAAAKRAFPRATLIAQVARGVVIQLLESARTDAAPVVVEPPPLRRPPPPPPPPLEDR